MSSAIDWLRCAVRTAGGARPPEDGDGDGAGAGGGAVHGVVRRWGYALYSY
jgi:hypothetical protein